VGKQKTETWKDTRVEPPESGSRVLVWDTPNRRCVTAVAIAPDDKTKGWVFKFDSESPEEEAEIKGPDENVVKWLPLPKDPWIELCRSQDVLVNSYWGSKTRKGFFVSEHIAVTLSRAKDGFELGVIHRQSGGILASLFISSEDHLHHYRAFVHAVAELDFWDKIKIRYSGNSVSVMCNSGYSINLAGLKSIMDSLKKQHIPAQDKDRRLKHE
jgi:hypothetical protein